MSLMLHAIKPTFLCGGVKIPKSNRIWETLITRYMSSEGIPLRWNETHKRFKGVKGFQFARLSAVKEGGFSRIPFHFKRFETERANGNPHPVVLFVMDARYGPDIEDCFAVMRMRTFTSLLKEGIEAHPTRYLGVE